MSSQNSLAEESKGIKHKMKVDRRTLVDFVKTLRKVGLFVTNNQKGILLATGFAKICLYKSPIPHGDDMESSYRIHCDVGLIRKGTEQISIRSGFNTVDIIETETNDKNLPNPSNQLSLESLHSVGMTVLSNAVIGVKISMDDEDPHEWFLNFSLCVLDEPKKIDESIIWKESTGYDHTTDCHNIYEKCYTVLDCFALAVFAQKCDHCKFLLLLLPLNNQQVKQWMDEMEKVGEHMAIPSAVFTAWNKKNVPLHIDQMPFFHEVASAKLQPSKRNRVVEEDPEVSDEYERSLEEPDDEEKEVKKRKKHRRLPHSPEEPSSPKTKRPRHKTARSSNSRIQPSRNSKIDHKKLKKILEVIGANESDKSSSSSSLDTSSDEFVLHKKSSKITTSSGTKLAEAQKKLRHLHTDIVKNETNLENA